MNAERKTAVMRRLTVVGALWLVGCALGADLPKPEPPAGPVMLPQQHEYQRVLRQYMATLT